MESYVKNYFLNRLSEIVDEFQTLFNENEIALAEDIIKEELIEQTLDLCLIELDHNFLSLLEESNRSDSESESEDSKSEESTIESDSQ